MRTAEPVIALPAARLLAASAGIPLALGAAWAAIGAASGVAPAMLGVWSGLLVASVMTVSIVILAPWTPRPLSLLSTLWLGATVARFILTPVLAWVLYSASSFGAAMLALAVGSIYLLALIGEVVVLAIAVRRAESTPPQS
jgi:hypothetical protein